MRWTRNCSPDKPIVFVDSTLAATRWIYHRLAFSRALQIFERRELSLMPVQNWTDPYEKWWCDQLFKAKGPLCGVNAYGQSWTVSSVDEPAWRMVGFGTSETIVRIRTRVCSLVAALEAFGSRNDAKYFLGRVSYVRESELTRLASEHQRVSETDKVGPEAAVLLCHKRRAFGLEKEIRLLRLDRAAPRDRVAVPFDASNAISQVMVTPHATAAEFKSIKAAIQSFGVPVLHSGVLRFRPT